MEFYVFQFMLIVSNPDIEHHGEGPGSISSTLHIRYWYTWIRSLDWSFSSPSRLKSPNSLKLHVGEMLVSFNHFSDPLPDTCSSFMPALCWGAWRGTQDSNWSTEGEINMLCLAGIDTTFRCNNLCAAVLVISVPWSNPGSREIYKLTASSQNTVSCNEKK